jgi:transposase-like protein
LEDAALRLECLMAALRPVKASAAEPLLRPLEHFWSEFPDEETCVSHLKARCWKNGPVCPYCGDTRFYGRADAPKLRCAGCHYTFSFKVGTLFQATTIPIRIWFAAIWILTNSSRGVTSIRLARELGLRQNTAWSMLHRLRHAASTPAFARPIRRGSQRAPTKQSISVAPPTPTPGRGYDQKLKLDIAFEEAIERFAVVEYEELRESLERSPRKRPPRRGRLPYLAHGR